jgi:quinoprotein glucose dehydrogenase
LALRRASVNSLDSFLNDADTHIVLEAARAIYDDRPQAGPALEALAGLSIGKNVDAFALRRVMNANARLGGKFRAEALVAMAVNAETPTASKVEALELLGAWNKASGKDRISGLWQPFAARPRDEAASAIESKLEELLKGSSESTVKAAIEAAGDLKITSVAPSLVKILKDEKTASDVRVAALKAIEQIGDTSLTDSVNIAVESKDAAVRSEGQRLLPKTDPTRAVAMLGKVLESGSVREKQNSVRVLADMGKPEADAILLARLKAHDLAPEVELDLLDAAAVRSSVAEIKAALLERTKPKSGNTDPLNGYSGVLVGGVNFKGRQIFETNTAVYCIRCHKVKGQGGEVGPDLSEIGAKQTREYIATSIIAPNHAIALGFETVVVSLNDGRVISGVFKSEDEKSLKLMSVDNQLIDIKKSDIEERKRGPSAMPEDVAKKLKKVQIRDLVEFLSSQKSK